MTIRDYYTENLEKLSPERGLHFAVTLKNWFNTDEFNDFLSENKPSHDLAEIFNDNNYLKADDLDLRRPYFEKYRGLYGVSRALTRTNLLLTEYDLDLRDELTDLIRKWDLYDLSDELMSDDAALASLTSYALDILYLTEDLFPRGKNVAAELAAKALHFNGSPALTVSLSTKIIIYDTNLYTRGVNPDNLPVYRPLITRCARLITNNLTTIPLDAKLAFLVASKLVHAAANPAANSLNDQPVLFPNAPTGFLALKNKISLECDANLRATPFLLDPRQPAQNDLDTAEPRNTLLILSGLDRDV